MPLESHWEQKSNIYCLTTSRARKLFKTFGRKLMKKLIKFLIMLINCLGSKQCSVKVSGHPAIPQCSVCAILCNNFTFRIGFKILYSPIITIWWFCPKLKSNYKTINLHKKLIREENFVVEIHPILWTFP